MNTGIQVSPHPDIRSWQVSNNEQYWAKGRKTTSRLPMLVTSRTIADIQDRKPGLGAVHATVIGHQWWWEIRYPDLGIVTANELHVPASTESAPQPTFLKLQSADVAHSFWVPQLAGKTDLIPNTESNRQSKIGNWQSSDPPATAWWLVRI
jgi:heme/copper-type cytochrome/quinol oxidase subunit 2